MRQQVRSRVQLLLVPAAAFLVASCSLEGDAFGRQVSASPSAPPASAPPVAAAPGPSARPRPTKAPTLAPPDLLPPPSPVPTYRADKMDLDPPDPPRPVRLTVASLDLELPVVRKGVDQNGAMALPDTVREVAWYQFGSRPGDPSGTTVLAAHVDTVREGLGPFARLRDVEEDASVALENADGDTFRYTVTDVRKINKRSVPLDEVFARSGPPRVVLITCGGAYDRGTGYRDNVVVTAVPEA